MIVLLMLVVTEAAAPARGLEHYYERHMMLGADAWNCQLFPYPADDVEIQWHGSSAVAVHAGTHSQDRGGDAPSASLAQFFDPAIGGIEYAAKHLDGAKNWWQVGIVAGIVVGALLSSRLSGLRRGAPSPVWQTMRGQGSAAGRFVFAGGFLMLLGARIADGCTSGHGISGMAQLSLGSFVAVTAMFAGGIATALTLRKS